ncbi:MAG: glutathione S-transferase N-terminal domain-containing protein [Pseudomonadota bacterium]
MIDLYTWTTPNGRKASIMLEECALDYVAHPINISNDEQFAPEFLKIAPNNKIPAIVDHDIDGDPVSVFESGAILVYLAEKTGQFLPSTGAARAYVLQWLFWQMGGFGPMLGQLGFFVRNAKEKIPFAIERYKNEATRLYGVLDKRLGEAEFLGGDAYSIADMSTYPWAAAIIDPLSQMANQDWPNVRRWMATLEKRPALMRGMGVPAV